MSYDVLLSRSGLNKLNNYEQQNSPDRRKISNELQGTAASSKSDCVAEANIEDDKLEKKSENINITNNNITSNCTPARKISSRSLNPFTQFVQFYTNDDDQQQTSQNATAGAGSCTHKSQPTRSNEESFPEIKGRVESKLMSMWHNVKYGKLSYIVMNPISL